MQSNGSLSQITTCIPTDLKQKAVSMRINYSKACVLGLTILIKQEEEIKKYINTGVENAVRI